MRDAEPSKHRCPERRIFKVLRSCSVALLALHGFAHSQQAVALENLPPPTFTAESNDFNAPQDVNKFTAASGNWQVNGGIYRNTVSGPTSLTVLQSYVDPNPSLGGAEFPSLSSVAYTYHTRMRHRAGSDGLVGLAFEHQDANNYYEVVFSPTPTPKRMAFLRNVRGGTTTVVASAPYAEGGPDLWFDVDLERDRNSTTVLVNGNPIFKNVQQAQSAANQLGLVTHNAIGEFDSFRVFLPTGTPAFKETFADGMAQGFRPQSGTWTVADGVYSNNVVGPTGITLAPINVDSTAVNLSLRARMFNPYGASGNTVGIAFSYSESSREYDEVVFSNVGTARIRHVLPDGTATTLATATIPKLSNQWFEVALHFEGSRLNVSLNDKPILSMTVLNRTVLFPPGPIGFVTHFSPGKFDNMEFKYGPFPKPYTENFNTTTPVVQRIDSGAWASNAGTYDSLAAGPSDRVALYSVPVSDIVNKSNYPTVADFVYRAKVQIVGAGANALAGLFTTYSPSTPTGAEYYETLFSPTGQVIINKIVQGTTVRQATGTYVVGSDPWINVEIRRVGTSTSLRVNGQPVFSGVLQGQLLGGDIGLITHNTQAKFDDVSWTELK